MNEVLQSPKQADICCTQVSLKEGLIATKERLEQKLKDVNETIQALEENPQVERLISLIQKSTRY